MKDRRHPWQRRLALVALALAGTFGAGCKSEGYRSGVFDPPREAPDFELEGSHGSPIALRDFRGKVVALAFGFSHCPRICPVTLSRLAEVDKSLGDLSKELQVVFVTVDPERDTPGRLREFLGFFDADFRGATGDSSKLDALQHAYGVVANKVQSENEKLQYEVHHSTSIYLIDKQGVLRLLVPFGEPAADILHDVKRLLDT